MVKIAQDDFCPLIKENCIQLKCKFFTKLVGKDPQTGKDIEDWDCAFKWIPMLLIENANKTRELGAAVESLRNEQVNDTQKVISALVAVTGYDQRVKQLEKYNEKGL